MLTVDEIINDTLIEVAKKMVVAATTAPKACGVNNTVLSVVQGNDIRIMSDKMKEIGSRTGVPFFMRDAENILLSPVVILIGTKISPMFLNAGDVKVCGMCGFVNCIGKNKHPETPCVFNTGDLGIAIGSAVSIAADNRVDNRVMYTVGQAAIELGLLGKDVKIVYGIPLSASSKSPFFDRK